MMPENIAETELWKTLLNNVAIKTSYDGKSDRVSTTILLKFNTIVSPVEKDPESLHRIVNNLVNDGYFRFLEMAGISRDDMIKANIYEKLVENSQLRLR